MWIEVLLGSLFRIMATLFRNLILWGVKKLLEVFSTHNLLRCPVEYRFLCLGLKLKV